jgi:hypothetical protein
LDLGSYRPPGQPCISRRRSLWHASENGRGVAVRSGKPTRPAPVVLIDPAGQVFGVDGRRGAADVRNDARRCSRRRTRRSRQDVRRAAGAVLAGRGDQLPSRARRRVFSLSVESSKTDAGWHPEPRSRQPRPEPEVRGQGSAARAREARTGSRWWVLLPLSSQSWGQTKVTGGFDRSTREALTSVNALVRAPFPLVPPGGFEPPPPAPEAGALSPELRGRGLTRRPGQGGRA